MSIGNALSLLSTIVIRHKPGAITFKFFNTAWFLALGLPTFPL